MSHKSLIKKYVWSFLYLLSLLSFCFAVMYFSNRDFLSAFIAFPFSLLLFSVLVRKEIKFLSTISFVSLIVTSFFIFAVSANQVDSIFLSILDEKIFMLTLPIILVFVLVNSIYWVKAKKGWKKVVALVFIFLSVLAFLLFGTSLPNFHQNFIYTRIFLLIFFILSIYGIKKGEKAVRILGILGIILSIVALLLSSALSLSNTYRLEGDEETEVLAFVDPKVKEMFDYFNKGDYENFCKYCGTELNFLNSQTPLIDQKEVLGAFVSFGDPQVKYEMGFYRVEYPVKFQKIEEPIFITFVINDYSFTGTIYGFEISGIQE